MDIKHEIEGQIHTKGVYRFTKAKLETPEQFALNEEIERRKRRSMPFLHLVQKLNSICKTEITYADNLVPTVGRTMLADNLTNTSPDNTPRVTHTAVGTGTTAPANGDTTLETETFRNSIASQTNADNVAYFTMFIAATEDTGTYREAGLFSDGTASADTGILVSRVAINITKSNTETLTIDWTLTIN